jgi:hypothetical protein
LQFHEITHCEVAQDGAYWSGIGPCSSVRSLIVKWLSMEPIGVVPTLQFHEITHCEVAQDGACWSGTGPCSSMRSLIVKWLRMEPVGVVPDLALPGYHSW